jgi:hypothetical protein
VLRQIPTDAPETVESRPLATAVAFCGIALRLDMCSAADRGLLTEWLDGGIDAR